MKTVVCAISGGIDSAVSAALLKEAGFEVVGVFMRFWTDSPRANRCWSREAELRARKIAKILKMPFYVFNFEKEFKKRVVDYFLKNYQKGITPNPCVVCNKEIKFGLMLEKALRLGADFVATGHYAKTSLLSLRFSNKEKIKLFRAKDKNKDQSYFLWRLNQRQLKKILFPLGDYRRREVQELAKYFGLGFLLKVRKSVEVCFARKNIDEFLKKHLKEKPGLIMDPEGRVIGEHKGLWFYTIGQRRKIRLPGGPWWVVNKNQRKNILIVTKNEKDLLKKKMVVKKVNWISGKEPKIPLEVKTKVRYLSGLAQSQIIKKLGRGKFLVEFKRAQRAITPGQSAVFYQGEEVIGGGIIC